MKFFSRFIVCVLVSLLRVNAQESVRPIVAPEFGKPIVVDAEFVAKSNDYYSQNWISEPYHLRVLAVGGQKLQAPVVIEYKLATEGKARKSVEKPGTITTFEAYESIYQPPAATPWLAEGMQGTDFVLVHVLHIRPKQKG